MEPFSFEYKKIFMNIGVGLLEFNEIYIDIKFLIFHYCVPETSKMKLICVLNYHMVFINKGHNYWISKNHWRSRDPTSREKKRGSTIQLKNKSRAWTARMDY